MMHTYQKKFEWKRYWSQPLEGGGSLRVWWRMKRRSFVERY